MCSERREGGRTARCGAQLGERARRASERVAPAVAAEDCHPAAPDTHAGAQRRTVSHEGRTDSESRPPTRTLRHHRGAARERKRSGIWRVLT